MRVILISNASKPHSLPPLVAFSRVSVNFFGNIYEQRMRLFIAFQWKVVVRPLIAEIRSKLEKNSLRENRNSMGNSFMKLFCTSNYSSYARGDIS